MILKDIVCKDYKYEDIIPYQLEIVAGNKMNFFVPMTYEILDSDNLRLCYNLSEMDPVRRGVPGEEAPYLASALIKGMRDSMNYFILPSQYLVKEKLVFQCRNGSIRIAYVPLRTADIPVRDPGKTIRKSVFGFLKELYNPGVEGWDKAKKVMDILIDNTIGMETCMRRIEKSKESISEKETSAINGVLPNDEKSYRIGLWK